MVDHHQPPIACTLSGASYRERLDSNAALACDGLRSRQRRDLTLELHYSAEVADRVREMVRKETACCAFLAFELAEGDGEVRVTVTAPEAAREIAESLFDQFAPRDPPPVASRAEQS